MLFDSGGSMEPYAQLCSSLFKAVNKTSRFRDLKTFYFHNCVYQETFTTPECSFGKTIRTDDILRNFSRDYKVIFVGDASMAPYELFSPRGSIRFPNLEPGAEWLRRFVDRYDKLIWLNPLPQEEWGLGYMGESIRYIAELIKMFPLTVQGLEAGLKYIMKAR
jgi:uncharacterized protein with von Willebrand factor type A (vWA) domain